MSAVALAPTRRIGPARERARDHRPALLTLAALGGIVAAVALSSREARPVLMPLAAMLAIPMLYAAVIIRRDRRVPVLDAGSMFIAVVTIYGSVPLLNFLAGGLQWSNFSDNRLFQYPSSPSEVGRFAWWYVALLVSFTVVYVLARGRVRPLTERLRRPDSATVSTIVAITIGLAAYFWMMARFFGLNYSAGYGELQASGGAVLGRNLPLVVQQVSHNLRGMLTIEKQLLLAILMGNWRSMKSRLVVFVWIAAEVIIMLTRYGSRTEVVILILTTVVLYDRFVRPLSLKIVMFGIAVGLVAVLSYGIARGAFMEEHKASISTPMATSTNEFQGLWATAFDLMKRRELGMLTHVPWQIYVCDFYLLIPSQLLPFEKIDPSAWYLDVINDHSGIGYMFGIMSQGAVGWGWIEIAFRGAILAIVVAFIHRWFVRHQSSFWPTCAYLFLYTWIYYSLRATTFSWVYFVFYRFLPIAILTTLIAKLLRAPRKSSKTRAAEVIA
jgi:hypothetical protein